MTTPTTTRSKRSTPDVVASRYPAEMSAGRLFSDRTRGMLVWAMCIAWPLLLAALLMWWR